MRTCSGVLSMRGEPGKEPYRICRGNRKASLNSLSEKKKKAKLNKLGKK